ncbi:hypothetical protein CMO96_02165 [Candidatus Woesebacteria bacterium]|nr:hypothetical protein [Candidatus Woesebacteria bacterium]|tara:strand:- start:2541 stop:3275 length:735 start_codon:yes stop_codon:yes gene_type:complete
MYQLPKLQKVKNLTHGFSTRQDGNVSFRFGKEDEVLKNRENFLKQLSISPKNCVKMTLEHSTDIEVVDKNHLGRGMFKEDSIGADALITKEKGIFLFVMVADCLPIILYDPPGEKVALVHAGWQGTDKKFLEKVVQRFSDLGSNPADIIVGIGPGIHKESYIHKDPEQKQKKDWEPFLKDLDDGQTEIDIVGYNIQQLVDSGVLKRNIEVSSIDTAKSKDFFSHYRVMRTGEPEGRFAAVVGMI